MLSKFAALLLINIADGYPTLIHLGVSNDILFISIEKRSDIFRIYDMEQKIFDDALIYFDYILIGFVPMFLSFAFASILRGTGDTKTPMWVTGFANILNIFGNYVLISGWGIFPEMGIGGAALSTSISRIVAVCIYIYVLYVKDSDIKLKAKWFVDRHIIAPLFRISLPVGIEQFFMQLSFLVVGVFISKLDTNAESLFRILIQIESLSFMPAVGVSSPQIIEMVVVLPAPFGPSRP